MRVNALLFSLLLAESALAVESSLLNSVDSVSIAVDCSVSPVYESNPAAMAYRHNFSLSSLALQGNLLNDGDLAVQQQQGTGFLQGCVLADSYIKLSDYATVWGSASFSTRKTKDVKWSNVADYELLAPYVLGDSVGGDLQARTYTFSGGYASIAGRFSWGASASYRAHIEYRNVDPRVRNIVSDLNISVGGTYALSHSYAVGVSASMRSYNQESDLEFYSPINDTKVFALSGLGSYNTRFAGTNNQDASYSGLGAYASLQLLNLQQYGIYLSSSYSYTHLKQMLRDYNNLDLSALAIHRVGLNAVYRTSILSPSLSAYWQRRIGTENLFGSSVGNTYEKIGSRQPYFNDVVDAELAFITQISVNRTRFEITPSVTYDYAREFYRSPRKDVTYCGTAPKVNISVSHRYGQKCHLAAGFGYGYRIASRNRWEISNLDASTTLSQMILQNINIASANTSLIGAQLSVDYLVTPSIDLFVKADYSRRTYCNYTTRDEAELSVGVRF